MSKIVAIITACGRGTRMNLEDGIPKQYLPIASIPMLRHSILAFLNHPKIDNVLCIIHPDDINLYEEATAGLDLLNPVFGSDTRQASIRLGLESLQQYKPQKVLIHDGVRPFVSKAIINGILEKLETHPAVIPAIAVEDTLKKYSDGKIEWTLERENLWRAQTPQGFLYKDILNSHIAFKDLSFTDDSALNEYAGIPVAIIPGSQNNFKVTTSDDYERAKKIAALMIENIKEETRSGIGYDAHAFDDSNNKTNKIRIAGIDIKHPKKIIAHSDGDVAIHAIIDALLGSASLGDIGEHFPANDAKFKDINSLEMLKTTKQLLTKNGAKIINIDLTIICQEPKILEHKTKMKDKISKCLNVKSSRVNIKATTTEGLGFTGRKEGIAAQAIATISVLKAE